MNIDSIINNIKYEEVLKYLGLSSLDSFEIYTTLVTSNSQDVDRYCIIDKKTKNAALYYAIPFFEPKYWKIIKDGRAVVKSITNESYLNSNIPYTILVEYEYEKTDHSATPNLAFNLRFYLMNKIDFFEKFNNKILKERS